MHINVIFLNGIIMVSTAYTYQLDIQQILSRIAYLMSKCKSMLQDKQNT